MIDYEHFREWLRKRGYRPRTVNDTVSDMKLLQRLTYDEEPVPPRLRWSAKRLFAYSEDNYIDRWPDRMRLMTETLATCGPDIEGPMGPKKRKHEATSFGDAEWRRLTGVIELDGTPSARVLQVMADTGLRVGDVLGISKKRLELAQRTGKIQVEVKGGDDRTLFLEGPAWEALYATWSGDGSRNVATLVCPDGDGSIRSGDCAYQRVRRALKRLGKKADVAGRLNTHRFRRTVGVQALRLTEDIPAVQQLLGHRSPKTTMQYLDEARPERVAELQRQLRKRFREEGS